MNENLSVINAIHKFLCQEIMNFDGTSEERLSLLKHHMALRKELDRLAILSLKATLSAEREMERDKGNRDSRGPRRDQTTGVDFQKVEPTQADSKEFERTQSGGRWSFHGFQDEMPTGPYEIVDVSDDRGRVFRSYRANSVLWSVIEYWRPSRSTDKSDKDEATDAPASDS